jgi:hypothetical protein
MLGNLAPGRRRTALDALSRERLIELCDWYELDIQDHRVRSQLIDGLIRAHRVDFKELLNWLTRDELKAMCDWLNLDTTGRKKQALIHRILDGGSLARRKRKTTRSPSTSTTRSRTSTDGQVRKSQSGSREALSGQSRVNPTQDEEERQMSELENRLWSAADQLRANSNLTSAQYSTPVLGLIFLRYADARFDVAHAELEGSGSGRIRIGPEHYQAKGVMYLPEEARFSELLKLPEGGDIGQALNDAMRAIEAHNVDLKDVLPKTYNRLENTTLAELLKLMNSIPMDIEGDAFGKIYEYFLGNFAMSEGQKGGEFFTPTAIVKLIVSIIEPFHGRIFDPACGSTQEEPHRRDQRLRAGARGGDHAACSHEPRCSWIGRRHTAGQYLLRGFASEHRRRWQVRLRDG